MIDQVDIVIVTKNAAQSLKACLDALNDFAHIHLIDSNSTDETITIAQHYPVHITDFIWNGQYPKKRQWCLENIPFKTDWVLFLDADEIMTADLVKDLRRLFSAPVQAAGYFIQGQYLWHSTPLRAGLRNSKLCLLRHKYFEFPIIDDLKCPAMGEIEGHYQPILKPEFKHLKIGTLKNPLLHDACDNSEAWTKRHKRYAAWECYMDKHQAWPIDPIPLRQLLKTIYRSKAIAIIRPLIAFLHSYILRGGIIDGENGYHFAKQRASYYAMINAAKKNSA